MNKPKILFLCTANSCRSQMAEGWAKSLLSSEVDAFSAGVAPKQVDQNAVTVMREAGIDISSHFSKTPESIGTEFDYVVTVCDHAHENCPFFPAKTKIIHHSFEDPPLLARNDPASPALDHYRRVRDEIAEYVKKLPELLAG